MSDTFPSPATGRTKPESRDQSRGEEIANSISHGVALVAALIGAQVLIAHAVRHHSVMNTVGASVFGGAMILMYLSSMLYHALPQHRGKDIFHVFDHAAIFILIAGTYTPLALGVLRGSWGWTILGLVWSLALAGIVCKVAGGIRHRKLSVALYLGMGWLILAVIRPLCLRMPPAGVAWVVGGGVAYTVGTLFYAASDRVKFAHLIWHLFVIAGTGCHYMAVLGYAV